MQTELPPNVLKYLILLPNSSMISGRAATPAMGMPLPIGLPMTARSGTMPWRWKPHIAAPVRPNPGWTSSAIYSPPASRTASASRTPCRFMSAIAARTWSAKA